MKRFTVICSKHNITSNSSKIRHVFTLSPISSTWCHFLLVQPLTPKAIQSQICRRRAPFHSDCSLHLAPEAPWFISAESLLANAFYLLANSSKFMPTLRPTRALHHHVRYYQHAFLWVLVDIFDAHECLKAVFTLKEVSKYQQCFQFELRTFLCFSYFQVKQIQWCKREKLPVNLSWIISFCVLSLVKLQIPGTNVHPKSNYCMSLGLDMAGLEVSRHYSTPLTVYTFTTKMLAS